MSAPGEPEVCITCGDVATPLEVVEVDEDGGLARCADRSERQRTVEIGLVQPVAVGDRLLVHAGTAIARLDGLPGGRSATERERPPDPVRAGRGRSVGEGSA